MDYLDYRNAFLAHHGIKGQKWGVRRFQNPDGSLTPEGRERYGVAGKRARSSRTEAFASEMSKSGWRVSSKNNVVNLSKTVTYKDYGAKNGYKIPINVKVDGRAVKLDEQISKDINEFVGKELQAAVASARVATIDDVYNLRADLDLYDRSKTFEEDFSKKEWLESLSVSGIDLGFMPSPSVNNDLLFASVKLKSKFIRDDDYVSCLYIPKYGMSTVLGIEDEKGYKSFDRAGAFREIHEVKSGERNLGLKSSDKESKGFMNIKPENMSKSDAEDFWKNMFGENRK